MRSSSKHRTPEDVARFVDDYLKWAGDDFISILVTAPKLPGDYFVVTVTEDSNITSPPTGSEQQQTISKTRPWGRTDYDMHGY